jgi:hypothetical protein
MDYLTFVKWANKSNYPTDSYHYNFVKKANELNIKLYNLDFSYSGNLEMEA